MSLGGLCGVAFGPADAWSQANPASMPPQEGDVLVRRGDQAAKPLTVADIPSGAAFLSAWAMEPTGKVVRSGSRLHEVLLVKLQPSELTAESQANAVNGVLAFSALCTHSGCDVSTWAPEKGILTCDCHGSEFDAKGAGKVLVGPAARALPPLALTLAGDMLVVARPFAGPIRFDEV